MCSTSSPVSILGNGEDKSPAANVLRRVPSCPKGLDILFEIFLPILVERIVEIIIINTINIDRTKHTIFNFIDKSFP